LPEVFWRETMSGLNERFPLTGISVYLAPPQDLTELVQQQAIDMAFGLDVRDAYPSNVRVSSLGEFRLLTVAATNHPLHQLTQALPEDLDQFREITLAFLHNNNLVARETTAASYQAMTMFELIRDAVIAGNGWARLPSPLIKEAIEAGALTAFSHHDTISNGSYVAITEDGALDGPVVTWLINRVEAYLGGLRDFD
jgi:DNA-binding transcriptional LysR family regulator